MQCSNCGTENIEGSLFCQECGQKLEQKNNKMNIICSNCKKANPLNANFCENCGVKLSSTNDNNMRLAPHKRLSKVHYIEKQNKKTKKFQKRHIIFFVATILLLTSIVTLIIIRNNRTQYQIQQANIVFKQINKHRKNLNDDIKSGWDITDNHFVSEQLTKKQLENMQQQEKKQEKEIDSFVNINDKSIQQKVKKIQKQETHTKKDLNELQSAFNATQATNKLFRASVVNGSYQKDSLIHTKINKARVNEVSNLVTEVNPKLKKILMRQVSVAQRQVIETSNLKKEIGIISNDGKLKSTVTIEQLKEFNTFVNNLEYPKLMSSYKNLSIEINKKMNQENVKSISNDELLHRIFFIAFMGNNFPGDYIQEEGNGWNEDTFIATSWGISLSPVGVTAKQNKTITVKSDNSYTISDDRGTHSIKSGNLMTEVNKDQLKLLRENVTKIEVPKISAQEFKSDIIEKINNTNWSNWKKEENDDYIGWIANQPGEQQRAWIYYKKTGNVWEMPGIVESENDLVENVDTIPGSFDSDLTMKIWNKTH